MRLPGSMPKIYGHGQECSPHSEGQQGCLLRHEGRYTMAEPGIFEIIYSTRAMRRLKPEPIPEETLKKIVDAGTRAPSGGNTQEWAFILVRDPDLKRFLRDYYWNTWQQLGAKRATPPGNLPPAQQRMLNAAADLAAHLDEVPVILLACAHK